ncbi:MAG: SsrA-binding protein SmpB [Chloroflexi bacterium]|nr:SsrA-binding protein SmpB [Chloroflexota bacterium]
MSTEHIKVVAQNRKARHDYEILRTFEAGLALLGSEIKSIRAGHANIRQAYVRVEGGEAWLVGANIAVYDPASRQNHDPERPRKLLLHSKEIIQLQEQVREKGLTIVPLQLYLARGRAKLEIAVARGKKQYDKRQAIAKRDAQRSIERALRRRGQ